MASKELTTVVAPDAVFRPGFVRELGEDVTVTLCVCWHRFDEHAPSPKRRCLHPGCSCRRPRSPQAARR